MHRKTGEYGKWDSGIMVLPFLKDPKLNFLAWFKWLQIQMHRKKTGEYGKWDSRIMVSPILIDPVAKVFGLI